MHLGEFHSSLTSDVIVSRFKSLDLVNTLHVQSDHSAVGFYRELAGIRTLCYYQRLGRIGT